VRGDLCYLANGNYGGYFVNAPTSGTATIEIRKAQSYNTCTNTGRNPSMMGSAKAVFRRTSSEPIFGVSTHM
jgi:hypothetical protein